jgi:neuropeptide Y receptor
VQRVGALLALGGIWTLACVLAAPLFIMRNLQTVDVNFPEMHLNTIHFCIEDWPYLNGRAYYSIFSIIIQYALPITVVSVAYFRICKKLRYRMKPGGRVTENPSSCGENGTAGLRTGSVRKDQARVRRTNMLLISIALIFGVSWMPLNAFNLLVDLFDPFEGDVYKSRVVYAFCHLIGMSSANTNPLLYGFFNDNFRKEFRDIWLSVKSCRFRGSRQRDDIGGRSIRESRVDREHTATVNYRKSKASPADMEEEGADIEQSTLITQVLDRQK